MSKDFPESYNIYRKGKTAAQFKIGANIDRPGIFVDLTDKPKGDAFDWKDKITIKLGLNDLGAMLSTIKNNEKELKLFHDPGAGTDDKGSVSRTITLVRNDSKQKGYYFNVTSSQDGKAKRISVAMNNSEITILECLITVTIPKMLRWK